MFRIKLLEHEDSGTMLLQNIRNHLLNDTHNLSVVIMFRSYLVIWKVYCVATVLMFGNGEVKLLFVPSLAAEKGLRMTERKFLMYELFISCLGKHHERVVI